MKKIIQLLIMTIYNKKFKKQNFLEIITRDLSNNYFNTINFINTMELSLVTYGKNLKENLMKKMEKIDLILVKIK